MKRQEYSKAPAFLLNWPEKNKINKQASGKTEQFLLWAALRCGRLLPLDREINSWKGHLTKSLVHSLYYFKP